MKLLVNLDQNARVITKNVNEYNFNGKPGTSYSCHLLISGDVQKFKFTKEVYEAIEIEKAYTFGLSLSPAYDKNNNAIPGAFTLMVAHVDPPFIANTNTNTGATKPAQPPAQPQQTK